MTHASISNSWFVCHKPNPQARLRLFCFPYAGGGASIFRNWGAEMPPHVEVRAIQLPGRENRVRENPFTTMPPLVEALALALQPFTDKPFIFFGHSVGALICFELARYLRNQRLPGPIHLLISGCSAPHTPNPSPHMHHLPDPVLMDMLRQLQGTPPSVLQNIELMQLLLPVFRADLTLYETYSYVPEPPLDCSISAFGGLEDPNATRDMLAAWDQQTQKAFAISMLPGGHFFLFSSHTLLLQGIAQDLLRLLAQSG